MSESQDKKPRRQSTDAADDRSKSNDPLQDSLDELARIADVLVDRLAMECDETDVAPEGKRTAAAVAEGPPATRDELKQRLDQLDQLVEVSGASQSNEDIELYLDRILRIGGEEAPEAPAEEHAAPPEIAEVKAPTAELAPPVPAPWEGSAVLEATPALPALVEPEVEPEEVTAIAPWPLQDRPAARPAAPIQAPTPPVSVNPAPPAPAPPTWSAPPAPRRPLPSTKGGPARATATTPEPRTERSGASETSNFEVHFPDTASRQKKGLPLAFAALGLVGVLAAGWWWMRSTDSDRAVAEPIPSARVERPPTKPPATTTDDAKLRTAEPQATAPMPTRVLPPLTPPSKKVVAGQAGATGRQSAKPETARVESRSTAEPKAASRTAPVAPSATVRPPVPVPAEIRKAEPAEPDLARVAATPQVRKEVTVAAPPTPQIVALPGPVVALPPTVPPRTETTETVAPPTVAATPQTRETPPSIALRQETPRAPAVPPPATAIVRGYQGPEILTRTEPPYPASAKKKGERGEIVLKVLVNENGRVARVVVEQGQRGSEIEASAINTVLHWTYAPATENGIAIRGWVTERFVFKP